MNFFAIFELCFGSVLWAFSFIATTWCLESFSPAYIVGLRFLISFLVSFILFHAIPAEKLTSKPSRLRLFQVFLLFASHDFYGMGTKIYDGYQQRLHYLPLCFVCTFV